MYGFDSVPGSQLWCQHPFPKWLKRCFLDDTDSYAGRFLNQALAIPSEGKPVRLRDRCRTIPAIKPGVQEEQGIRHIIIGERVVKTRNPFVEQFGNLPLAQIMQNHMETCQHITQRRGAGDHEPAISQPFMADECAVGVKVRRQYGNQRLVVENHQRMVGEPVAVIVHVIAGEKESRVLGCAHECVPLQLATGGVSLNREYSGVVVFWCRAGMVAF